MENVITVESSNGQKRFYLVLENGKKKRISKDDFESMNPPKKQKCLRFEKAETIIYDDETTPEKLVETGEKFDLDVKQFDGREKDLNLDLLFDSDSEDESSNDESSDDKY